MLIYDSEWKGKNLVGFGYKMNANEFLKTNFKVEEKLSPSVRQLPKNLFQPTI